MALIVTLTIEGISAEEQMSTITRIIEMGRLGDALDNAILGAQITKAQPYAVTDKDLKISVTADLRDSIISRQENEPDPNSGIIMSIDPADVTNKILSTRKVGAVTVATTSGGLIKQPTWHEQYIADMGMSMADPGPNRPSVFDTVGFEISLEQMRERFEKDIERMRSKDKKK